MDRRTIIILLCVVFLAIVTVLIACVKWYFHIQKKEQVLQIYHSTFRHPPDSLTMDRWARRPPETLHEFIQAVKASQDVASGEKIIFTGLCQDHANDVVSHWIPLVEYIGSFFQDYRILLLENDSRDNSRQVLLKESRRNPKILVLCDEDIPLNAPSCNLGFRSINDENEKETKLESRIDKIAYLRDVYLKRIGRKWSHYQFMVVIDWDLIGQFSIEGFFHGLSILRGHQEVDVVAVNSFYPRDNQWNIYDTFPLLDHRVRCDRMMKQKRQMDEETNQHYKKRLAYEQDDPLHIDSAFGGIGLYYLPRVIETRSHYFIPKEEQSCPIECEHSSFHRHLNVVIDPWFIFLIEKNLH